MTNQTHIPCLNCNYNLFGIDLAGQCPECGSQILQKCFWCDYDLTSTSPDANCPECGVPAINSIGDGILATVPDALLRSIHSGFKLVTVLVLAYILWVMVIGVIVGTLFGILDNAAFDVATLLISHVVNILFLVMIFGWWKLASPIPGIPESIAGSPQRKLLKTTLRVYTIMIWLSMLISFVPTNSDPAAPSKLIDYINIGIGVVGLAVLYFAQLWYIQWFTKLIKNQMMHKRAKYMIWLGLLIMVLGFISFTTSVGSKSSFFIALLIVLLLYWNMLACIGKDLKSIRQHNRDLA